MELILRSFLWQGGKQENKTFSLVRWEQVVLPYEQGGLSIWLHGLMNATLGMKIAWRLIIGNESWWKKALINKSLNVSKENLLNGNIPIRQSTQVWKLVKRFIPIMGSHISKTPGNGRKTLIWEDIIMGKDPLQDHSKMEVIQEWMRRERP